ncbi:MAG TPA: sulfatase/phosphatase domain-containing protein, partial [Sphingobacteriaceae bacterium]
SSGGFREGKGTSFEGGQRVPCIMQWKGKIQAGLVSNQLSSTIDILPTLAAITGAELPSKKIDGVDISEILKGDMTVSPRREFLYYFKKNALEGVRIDHWKYVFRHPSKSYQNQKPGKNGFPGKTPEVVMEEALYDLRRDPGERYDVKEYYPDIVKQLMVLAESARADLGDDLQHREGSGRRKPGTIK